MRKRSYNALFLKRKNWWVGWTPNVPGAVTQGRTLTEVKANLCDAIRLILAPVALDEKTTKVIRERISVWSGVT